MAQSKLFSTSYTRFCLEDVKRGLVEFYPTKGSFVTLDIADNPALDNYDNSAEYWCEYLDGELQQHLHDIARAYYGSADKPVFFALYSRRYATVSVTFTDSFLENEEVECIICHDNGSMQYYPSGGEVQPEHVHHYSCEEYGDDCLGYHGSSDRYMVYRDMVYTYEGEKQEV